MFVNTIAEKLLRIPNNPPSTKNSNFDITEPKLAFKINPNGGVADFDNYYKNPKPFLQAKAFHVGDDKDGISSFKTSDIPHYSTYFFIDEVEPITYSHKAALYAAGGKKYLGKSIIERGLTYEDEMMEGDTEKVIDSKGAFMEQFRAQNKNEKTKVNEEIKSLDIKTGGPSVVLYPRNEPVDDRSGLSGVSKDQFITVQKARQELKEEAPGKKETKDDLDPFGYLKDARRRREEKENGKYDPPNIKPPENSSVQHTPTSASFDYLINRAEQSDDDDEKVRLYKQAVELIKKLKSKRGTIAKAFYEQAQTRIEERIENLKSEATLNRNKKLRKGLETLKKNVRKQNYDTIANNVGDRQNEKSLLKKGLKALQSNANEKKTIINENEGAKETNKSNQNTAQIANSIIEEAISNAIKNVTNQRAKVLDQNEVQETINSIINQVDKRLKDELMKKGMKKIKRKEILKLFLEKAGKVKQLQNITKDLLKEKQTTQELEGEDRLKKAVEHGNIATRSNQPATPQTKTKPTQSPLTPKEIKEMKDKEREERLDMAREERQMRRLNEKEKTPLKTPDRQETSTDEPGDTFSPVDIASLKKSFKTPEDDIFEKGTEAGKDLLGLNVVERFMYLSAVKEALGPKEVSAKDINDQCLEDALDTYKQLITPNEQDPKILKSTSANTVMMALKKLLFGDEEKEKEKEEYDVFRRETINPSYDPISLIGGGERTPNIFGQRRKSTAKPKDNDPNYEDVLKHSQLTSGLKSNPLSDTLGFDLPRPHTTPKKK